MSQTTETATLSTTLEPSTPTDNFARVETTTSETPISEATTSEATTSEATTSEATTSEIEVATTEVVTAKIATAAQKSFVAVSSTGNEAKPSLPSVEDMKREERVAAIAMQARLDLRRGQREKARAEIARALALNPNDVGALELMGDVFLEEGEQEKAIVVFQKGRALHPNHAPFEEKIRLAQRDLDEMAVDQLTQKFAPPKQLLSEESDVKPGRAAMLSLLIPGGGQFYLEQNERGAVYLGLAVVSLCGWALPLRSAMSHAGQAVKATGSILSGWSSAVASMSGATQTLFWTMSTLFSILYLVSAWDAFSTVARRQTERRQTEKLNTEYGIRNTE